MAVADYNSSATCCKLEDLARLTTTDDGWVSVELGSGWCAHCRLVPRRGRLAIVELHVRPADADAPPLNSEITTTLLRRLRRTDVIAQAARQRPTRSPDDLLRNMPKPHGKRRRDERILATVAIVYEEHVADGSRHPARDVWEALSEFHDLDPGSYPAYTRSSVRTLIREARERGYLFDDEGTPRLVTTAPPVVVVYEDGHEEILAGDSASATIRRAERRDGRRRPSST